GLRDAPQEFVAVKSPALSDAVMSVSATSPELVSVTCCDTLMVPIACCANVSAAGLSVSVAGALPVPEICAVCVPALSAIVSTPVRVPLPVGVKLMESEQAVWGASVAVQVLAAIAKSPVIDGEFSVAGLEPVFATVMICAAAV